MGVMSWWSAAVSARPGALCGQSRIRQGRAIKEASERGRFILIPETAAAWPFCAHSPWTEPAELCRREFSQKTNFSFRSSPVRDVSKPLLDHKIPSLWWASWVLAEVLSCFESKLGLIWNPNLQMKGPGFGKSKCSTGNEEKLLVGEAPESQRTFSKATTRAESELEMFRYKLNRKELNLSLANCRRWWSLHHFKVLNPATGFS